MLTCADKLFSFGNEANIFKKPRTGIFFQNYFQMTVAFISILHVWPGIWPIAVKMKFECICFIEVAGKKRYAIVKMKFYPVIGKFDKSYWNGIIINIPETERGYAAVFCPND